ALVILVPTVTGTHPPGDDENLEGGLIPNGKASWLTRNPVTNYIRRNIGHLEKDGSGTMFAIAPGLDLKGGLRLVYTVGVDDAISEKRDNAADDMKQRLAIALGFHSDANTRVTIKELNDLREKVKVSPSGTNEIRLHFADPEDKKKTLD